eukprot:14313580-Alexandrium_andersonii.AAC.1
MSFWPQRSQALCARLLYAQPRGPISSTYMGKLDPPAFAGETGDLVSWSGRFIWSVRTKSPRIAVVLQSARYLRPCQLLREFALGQVQATSTPQHAESVAKLVVAAGRELFGHLQVALRGVRLDRQ